MSDEEPRVLVVGLGWIGGVVCLVGVIATGFALPRFWRYRSSVIHAPG